MDLINCEVCGARTVFIKAKRCAFCMTHEQRIEALLVHFENKRFVETKDKEMNPKQIQKMRMALELILKGLKSGSIKSKPIIEMPPGAKEWRIQSLEEIVIEALGGKKK